MSAPAGNDEVREALERIEQRANEGRGDISSLQETIHAMWAIARAALAAPQPREAEPVTPITNPLVLPAGIKAGDYASPSPIPEAPGGAIADIAAERLRQISEGGWTLAHDDGHENGEMAEAAAAYCQSAAKPKLYQRKPGAAFTIPMCWRWSKDWWKPKNPRADLVRAGGLVVAEIERLDRALKPQDGGKCEHGIAKVNCGICVPSKVFSGESGR